jgi:hypothetical protein
MSKSLTLSICFILMLASGTHPAFAQDSSAAFERMFAASPQRDLKRDWDRCVSVIASGSISNGKSAEDFQKFVSSLCADEESKLTGWMVREFGFDRGNAAIAWAKKRTLASVQNAINSREKANHPPHLIEVMKEGWRIFRPTAGTCWAVREDGAPAWPRSVLVLKSPSMAQAVFLAGMSVAQAATVKPGQLQVKAIWSSNASVRRTEGSLEVGLSERGTLVQSPIDDKVIIDMSAFSEVTFDVPGRGSSTHNIWGLRAAWERVKVCASA